MGWTERERESVCVCVCVMSQGSVEREKHPLESVWSLWVDRRQLSKSKREDEATWLHHVQCMGSCDTVEEFFRHDVFRSVLLLLLMFHVVGVGAVVVVVVVVVSCSCCD